MSTNNDKPDASKICFGLSEELDRESFYSFISLLGKKELLEPLSNRLSSEEIINITDQLMVLLRSHLSKDEYHELFLGEPHHH